MASASGAVIVGATAATTSNDGEIIVTRVDSSGASDASYGSLTPSHGASWVPAGAVIEPTGRLVGVATGTPGGRYPYRIALFGFDENGRLDPSFGVGGEVELSEPGSAAMLSLGAEGDLHVAARSRPASGGMAPSGRISTTRKSRA